MPTLKGLRMSVARRNDGRYVVKFKDEEGRWRQRSFRSEAEAATFDSECQYDESENERLTVLEAVLVYLKNTVLAPTTISIYKFIVHGYQRKDGTHTAGPAEILASRFVDTLTWRDLNTVRDNCRARNMKPTSINAVTGKLCAAFNWCAGHDLLEKNPWAKYGRLEARSEHRTGTLEDFRKIYAHLPEWFQWACRTAMSLCLRPGIVELFRLRWSAFRWQERAVSVYMGKVGEAKTVYPPEDYLEEAWTRFCADKRDSSMLVCRSGRGGPVSADCYLGAWKRACRRAGVKMPLYAVRHICASEMLAGGADLAAVAAQLGHKDLTTTGRYYAHALPSAQKAAAKALPSCTNLVQVGAENKEKQKQ